MKTTDGNEFSVVALVPAKMTSRRLKRKNLAPLAGVPLFVHSVKVALRSKYIGPVFVSTESDELADVAAVYECQVISRPEALSEADASNMDVVKHALQEIRSLTGTEPELVVLLQPSHPFRDPADLDDGIAKMLDTPDASSLVSVAPLHKSVSQIANGRWADALTLGPQRHRSNPRPFVNRGSFTVFRPRLTFACGLHYGSHVMVKELSRPEIDIDIDTPWDYEIAQHVAASHPEVVSYLND